MNRTRGEPRSRGGYRGATRALVAALAVGASAWTAACGVPEPGPVSVPEPEPDQTSYVVMVSFDGMRYDFIDRTPTPNFHRVAEAGVRARGLIPGYPSKTFPNHYSIATGLYPSNHGLVDNSFYDPVFDATYRIGDRDAVRDGRWYGGEPIWVTAENEGVRTASYFWVGTEAPIEGVHPTYFKYYDGSVPFGARVDTVLHWLSLPEPDRPRLVLLYFDEPDHTAHSRGPDDPAVDAVVRQLDGYLGQLLDGLAALPIADQVTVILVSDHGMAPVPRDSVVYLDDYTDLTGVRVIVNATQALLYFDGDTARVAGVYDDLGGMPHATAYYKADTPLRWHYDHGRRIGDLVVAADPGWMVGRRGGSAWPGGGMHGWDPYYRPMQGIFLAAGPRIRPGLEIPAFENVNIYPFLAYLLGVEPAEGLDGGLEILNETLLEPAMSP